MHVHAYTASCTVIHNISWISNSRKVGGMMHNNMRVCNRKYTHNVPYLLG